MLKQLSILGFRGFGKKQILDFALPDNKTPGSGLTIIVGPNNSGKTTIIESIQAFNGYETPSFSEGRRNEKTDGKIEILVVDNNDEICTISTVPEGGGLTNRKPETFSLKSYVVPSRRAVEFSMHILRLRDLYNRLKNNEIGTCRISTKDFEKVMLYAKSMKGSTPNIINFLYAFLQQPFESENVERRQDEYLAYNWEYDGKMCYGLALAVIMETMAVSTGDPIQWDKPVLSLLKDESIVQAKNLYGETTFSCHLQWLLDSQPVQLKQCQTLPSKKKIHLRDDHGKDVLKIFSRNLVCSPYVCEVINSMPFNSANRHFIHAVKEDGIIEIVLPWTDKGLGVVVKTTGKNRRETEKIAEMLKEEYGYL